MVLACVYHIAILVGFKYTEFLTGGAVEVGWAPLGPVSYTHLDVYKRQIQAVRYFGDPLTTTIAYQYQVEMLSLIHI